MTSSERPGLLLDRVSVFRSPVYRSYRQRARPFPIHKPMTFQRILELQNERESRATALMNLTCRLGPAMRWCRLLWSQLPVTLEVISTPLQRPKPLTFDD